MKGDRPPDAPPAREERVRQLGFDPGYLTPLEQDELLEIHSWSPEEPLATAAVTTV